jgi:hypothetical protein
MSTDFSKFQPIINKLRGEVGSSNFESKFAALTKNLPKTEMFLLKMELKRLASPCTRLIDLRGLVDGECKPYEHDGRIHFLDDVAIKTFEENLAYYGDYTFGVYDATMNTENNFRVIYQKEKEQLLTENKKLKASTTVEKTQYPARLIINEACADRREERMNLAIKVMITIEDSKNTPQRFEAMTSDISVSGCKLRLPEHNFLHRDQKITVEFTGLATEFVFGTNTRFVYQVRNIYFTNKIQQVGIERIEVDETKKDSLKHFLAGYIQGNKHRYKINLDNTLHALQARIFEQAAIPKSNELAVYIQQTAEQLVPKYAMTTPNNLAIYQYWQNENHKTTLAFLLNKTRLTLLQKVSTLGNTLTVYCFIHKSNGKYYFYSADDQQLKADATLRRQFIGFAANKENFSIFNLALIKTNTELAYIPLTLSTALPKQSSYLNLPLSEEVKDTLTQLPFIVTIADITSADKVKEYQQLDYSQLDKAQVRSFGHKYPSEIAYVDEIGISYRNQRQEARFIYHTDVIVSQQKVTWQGKSEDFSISGLKITLNKPAVLHKGDIVYLSFPKLQKISAKFTLNNLPYEIVRINKKKDVLNLRVHVEKHQHIGRSFFKLLIEKNRDKLKPDEYALLIPGLAKALRNIYAHSIKPPSLIVQTSGSRYKTDVIFTAEPPVGIFAEMKNFSDTPHRYNLYPLLHHAKVFEGLDSTLKRLHADDEPVTEVLYISINPNKALYENAVVIKRERELASAEMKKMFIKRALKQGSFHCVTLKLSRTNEPEMEYLTPELSYIGTYAIHRAKQLEQEIWSIAGVIQVFDVTSEALNYYKLS